KQVGPRAEVLQAVRPRRHERQRHRGDRARRMLDREAVLAVLARGDVWPVLTVTVSPALKGLSGRKLPPLLSESPSIRPLWVPLREPTTVTCPIEPGETPRNVIWVRGRL